MTRFVNSKNPNQERKKIEKQLPFQRVLLKYEATKHNKTKQKRENETHNNKKSETTTTTTTTKTTTMVILTTINKSVTTIKLPR